MAHAKLNQKEWEQAKVLFEKFILAGNGSFEDIETEKMIRSVYTIGDVSVVVSWYKNYRDTQVSNRKVCSRLAKKVDLMISATKRMDQETRSVFIGYANDLTVHLASMWSTIERGTGVIPSPIHFRDV
jgi:hypothetical protein